MGACWIGFIAWVLLCGDCGGGVLGMGLYCDVCCIVFVALHVLLKTPYRMEGMYVEYSKGMNASNSLQLVAENFISAGR